MLRRQTHCHFLHSFFSLVYFFGNANPFHSHFVCLFSFYSQFFSSFFISSSSLDTPVLHCRWLCRLYSLCVALNSLFCIQNDFVRMCVCSWRKKRIGFRVESRTGMNRTNEPTVRRWLCYDYVYALYHNVVNISHSHIVHNHSQSTNVNTVPILFISSLIRNVLLRCTVSIFWIVSGHWA